MFFIIDIHKKINIKILFSNEIILFLSVETINKIYLDTTVINFLYYDLAPDYRDVTIELFDNFIKLHKYDTYISPYVIDEINATKDEKKRMKLLNTFVNYPIKSLELTDTNKLQSIADFYVELKIIPERKYLDALHIAVSVVNEMDYLVSWNFRHLANVERERRIHAANQQLGFTKEIRIITPMELINYDSENI